MKRYWGHQDPTTRRQRECQNNIGVIRKPTTLHLHHTFLYISLPYLHDYDLKMPNFARFMENVNKQRRNLISLLKLGYVPEEFNARCVRPHLTK